MLMKIDHLAIWTENLEATKDFYVKYFDMLCSEKYTNEVKRFTSYFLSFKDSSTKLELMHRPDIEADGNTKGLTQGITHFAISVGSNEVVNSLTEKLRAGMHTIQSEPRTTGDGYYESVVLDPEGNLVEITA